MAQLNLSEVEQMLSVLADGGPPERLRDRLARLNAFHSRRGLNSLKAIAERVFALSSGLRRDVPANRALQALWVELITSRITQKTGGALDELADRINGALDDKGAVREGSEDEIAQVLGEYEELMARKVGGVAARLDMLQKAVPVVAEMLRAKPVLDVPLDPPEEDDDHDHSACDHDHDHDHDHGHDHEHDHE